MSLIIQSGRTCKTKSYWDKLYYNQGIKNWSKVSKQINFSFTEISVLLLLYETKISFRFLKINVIILEWKKTSRICSIPVHAGFMRATLTDEGTWPLCAWLETAENCCACCMDPVENCPGPASPARSTAGSATEPMFGWSTLFFPWRMMVALRIERVRFHVGCISSG